MRNPPESRSIMHAEATRGRDRNKTEYLTTNDLMTAVFFFLFQTAGSLITVEFQDQRIAETMTNVRPITLARREAGHYSRRKALCVYNSR